VQPCAALCGLVRQRTNLASHLRLLHAKVDVANLREQCCDTHPDTLRAIQCAGRTVAELEDWLSQKTRNITVLALSVAMIVYRSEGAREREGQHIHRMYYTACRNVNSPLLSLLPRCGGTPQGSE